MEDFKQMTARHQQEIKQLQDSCKHEKISDWGDYFWAVGHAANCQVKVCEFCGKVVQLSESRIIKGIITNTTL